MAGGRPVKWTPELKAKACETILKEIGAKLASAHWMTWLYEAARAASITGELRD